MISVITCTARPENLKLLHENLNNTIGVEFEFLPFDNSKQKFSLAKVYNLQSQKAAYDIICFVHDDVKFLTKDWGKYLLETFEKDKLTGLIGVAGSAYKTSAPSMWTTAPGKLLAANINQHYKYKLKSMEHLYWRNTESDKFQVVSIDGVFMATKKEIIKLYKFDEDLLKGFHCYDLDFSLQVIQTHKVIVSFNILLDHFSEGDVGYSWLETNKLISKKWNKTLPVGMKKLSSLEKDRLEYSSMFVGFRILKSEKKGFLELLKHFLFCFKISFLLMPVLKNKIDKHLSVVL